MDEKEQRARLADAAPDTPSAATFPARHACIRMGNERDGFGTAHYHRLDEVRECDCCGRKADTWHDGDYHYICTECFLVWVTDSSGEATVLHWGRFSFCRETLAELTS